MRVLVAGDNHQVVTCISQALQAAGYRTELQTTQAIPHAKSPRREAGERSSYAAIVLVCHATGVDCDRRRCNGSCPLSKYRCSVHGSQPSAKHQPSPPVLVIAAEKEAEAKCLNAGADDFLCQPYPIPVLIARVWALIRRCSRAPVGSDRRADREQSNTTVAPPVQTPDSQSASPTDGVIRLTLGHTPHVTNLTLDTAKRIATRNGRPIRLTERQTALLKYLMDHVGEICPRDDILEKAWGHLGESSPSLVDVTIVRLLKKLGQKTDGDCEPKLIHNEYGEGFVLKVK